MQFSSGYVLPELSPLQPPTTFYPCIVSCMMEKGWVGELEIPSSSFSPFFCTYVTIHLLMIFSWLLVLVMHRRHGSTHRYVHSKDLEQEVWHSGATDRRTDGVAKHMLQPPLQLIPSFWWPRAFSARSDRPDIWKNLHSKPCLKEQKSTTLTDFKPNVHVWQL